MEDIQLKDFKIVPIEETVRHEDIDDSIYFGTYQKYISNSKLNRISPRRNGSMNNYYNPTQQGYSECLENGSFIHEMVLQPESFILSEKQGRPSAKLGAVIDEIKKNRKQGLSIYDSITKACNTIDYYTKNPNAQLKKIITKECLKYYLKTKDFEDNILVPSDKNYELVINCINSLKTNPSIYNRLHPVNEFGEEFPSFMEDTIYKDYLVIYQNRSVILHFRGKIDNWTIDPENKILTLNDLKTSSDEVNNQWMAADGHFMKFAYDMQMYVYSDMLKTLAKQLYEYDDTWTFKCNILAVQTRWRYDSRCFRVTENNLETGRQSFEDALKRVAYYEIFGHDEEVNFI